MISERQWYASKEHFNTEMSYEEYLRRRRIRNSKVTIRKPGLLKKVREVLRRS